MPATTENKTIRILLAEDDADTARSTVRLLTQAGYVVSHVTTGAEALEYVRANEPDLMLQDRNLPDGDGLDICRQIKADPALRNVFVVMISSSYTSEAQQVEGLEGGADGYISRPIGNQDLLARVAAFVRIVGLNRQLRESETNFREKAGTLAAVTEALAAYVERGDWKAAMGRLLRHALDQTQSEYGFIGVVIGSTLRVLAHEGIVWDKVINRDFYEQALRRYEQLGYLEFTSFNNLFGRAITTRQVVIANLPDSDPRASGRPTGHPPMHSFMGVPIFGGGHVQGMVALANRPGGYSEEEQRCIETLVQHAGGLCTSYRQHEAALVLEQERAHADAALHDSEAMLRIAGQAARLGGWTLDPSAQKLTWSDQTFRIHELTPGTTPSLEEAIGFYSPEYREEMACLVHACATEGIPFDFELELVTAKERRIWVRAIGEALRDADGRIVRVQGAFQDITEQTLTARKLQQGLALLRIAGGVAKVGGWSVSVPGNEIYWSDEVFDIVEYPRGAEPPLEQALDLYPEPWRTQISEAITLCATQGTPFELDLKIKSFKGRVFWARCKGEAVRAADGRITQVQGAFQDITERRRAEESVRENEERFRLLAKATNDAIWDWNLLTDHLWWNEGYEALFGYSREQADPTVKSWTDHIHPEDLARVRADIHHAIEHGGEGWSDEYRFQCKDGRYAHVLDRGHVIRDAAGTPVRMIGGMTDLTKLKEHEIALSQSNRALELLSRCNEALVRSESESGLLAAICQIAVDVGGFRLAWVGYARDDADQTIESQSSAGIEDGYLSTLQVSWAHNAPLGQSPAGRVIRHGEPVVIPDLEKDDAYHPWLDAAKARGYRGVIALPLTSPKRTFGVLVLYLPEVRQPLPDEMRLLRELADDLAFGIVNIRTRLDRERLHAAVEQIATAVAATTNKGFFEQLARNMAVAVGAQAGFVARVLPGTPATVRTIVAVVDNRVAANFEYVLEGTPCDSFFTTDECVIPEKVAEQFPRSPSLAALGAQGYVGRRLDSSAGKFLGLLFVIFREPIKEADFVTSTLQIFAARAAAELEREETDAQVREQAALLDKAQDAISVRDLDHHITYWNSGAARLYGWTAEEAVGRSVRELLYHDAIVFDYATAETRARGEWVGKLDQYTKSGDNISVEGRWTLVRDEQGNPKSILAINTDITERKKLEQQFLRSQRMESIGTLAGGIAHDLNNALAPILMSSELLRMQFPGESELLDMVENGSKRARDMVRQLLSFAKGTPGERVPLQSGHLVKEMHDIMKGTFPKNIDLLVSSDEPLPTVLGDATQLHQVLLNLCVNARDAMHDGGTLTVRAECREVDASYAGAVPDAKVGTYVALTVRDTGTGIAPEVLDRIFEPFFTTKGQERSTGLGLSTVMGIVKGHGGFLEIHSQLGAGSVFTVFLPADAEGSQPALPSQPPEPFRGTGETILLVDDEGAVRAVARTILRRLNLTPLIAVDGTDGLLQAAQHRNEIRAVITDLHMPHMDGLAFVRALRQILPEIPVVVASGRLEDAVAEEFRMLGVTVRLDKPFTPAELSKALTGILG